MEATLAGLARGELYQPLRPVFRPPGAANMLGLMPAHRTAGSVDVLASRRSSSRPGTRPSAGSTRTRARVLLHDGETGELVALLNASPITEIRDCRRVGRRDAGAGAEGRARRRRSSAQACSRARTSRRCSACCRTPRSASGAGASEPTAEAALDGADVVCTCTTSRRDRSSAASGSRPGAARERGRLVGPDRPRARRRDDRRRDARRRPARVGRERGRRPAARGRRRARSASTTSRPSWGRC